MNQEAEPPEKLTLHQAADSLNASTTYVKGLLEQGLIAHLRIDRDSLLAYKARYHQELQAVLDVLTHEAQEQGYGHRAGSPAGSTATCRACYHQPESCGYSSHGLVRDESRV